MKLFLCSSFITEDLKPDYDRFVGNLADNPKVACITTAFNGYKELCAQRGESPDFSWFDYEDNFARKVLGWNMDLIDLQDLSKNELGMFDVYDGIWVEGGLMLPLIQAIHRTGFADYLKNNFLKKNTFYVGTSAGSMVCSHSIDAAEWYIGEPEPGVTEFEGLGLIDFQIYPHYNEANLAEIQAARKPSEEYWLLKDGQAVSVDNSGTRVFGGEITVLPRVT